MARELSPFYWADPAIANVFGCCAPKIWRNADAFNGDPDPGMLRFPDEHVE